MRVLRLEANRLHNERELGAQQLVVEMFRIAVHDARQGCVEHALSAREFLSSEWAEYLAALAGIPILEVRRRLPDAPIPPRAIPERRIPRPRSPHLRNRSRHTIHAARS